MIREYKSDKYNWKFNTVTGLFKRWGETEEDDPTFSPIGPEILDLEISTICSGVNGQVCNFCYKSNMPQGKYMSIEKLTEILNTLPNNLTQVALGIGDYYGYPRLEQAFQEIKKRGIVPNITINGSSMDDAAYSTLARYCGGVAVSNYGDNICFNAVRELTRQGLKQVNIHQVLSYDTFDDCLRLLDKAKTDPRLKDLNAIVFLMLKQKGRAVNCRPAIFEQFKQLCDKAMVGNVNIGFDSCSAPSFLKAIKDRPDFNDIATFVEPCESFLFSAYCNVDGEFFPCSFAEGSSGWEKGLPITPETNFLKDIWNHPKAIEWREKLLTSSSKCSCSVKSFCRSCPIYSKAILCV